MKRNNKKDKDMITRVKYCGEWYTDIALYANGSIFVKSLGKAFNPGEFESIEYDDDKKAEMVVSQKPPLGIIPKKIYLEKINEQRKKDLKEAIFRYLNADLPIHEEWIEEYNELVAK